MWFRPNWAASNQHSNRGRQLNDSIHAMKTKMVKLNGVGGGGGGGGEGFECKVTVTVSVKLA